MKKFFPILLLLSTTPLWARSGGAGNGGDAIVCPDKVILLDSYEAEKMKFDVYLGDMETATWRSMVNVAVKRLSRVDETTATLLYDYAIEMVNDFEKFQLYPDARGKNVYIGYDIIAEINDSEHVSTPEGCEEHPRQLVSQRKPKFRKEFRYEFSLSLWEKMNILEQSMTILHEAWYRIMLENGAENSRAARYMNGLVASRYFETMTFLEYIEEIKETELKHYIVPNNSESIKQSEIHFDLKKHILNFDETNDMVCAPNFKLDPSIKKTYSILDQSQDYLKDLKFQEVCFRNSRIKKLVLPTDVVNKGRTLRLPFHQVEFEKATNSQPSIVFDDKGKLAELTGMTFDSVMEMYYECDGRKSYVKRFGCERGPFIDHDTKISKPSVVRFSERELPLQYTRAE